MPLLRSTGLLVRTPGRSQRGSEQAVEERLHAVQRDPFECAGLAGAVPLVGPRRDAETPMMLETTARGSTARMGPSSMACLTRSCMRGMNVRSRPRKESLTAWSLNTAR